VLQDVSTGFDELKDAHALDKGQTLVRVDVLETKAMEARMTVVKAAEITDSISTPDAWRSMACFLIPIRRC
jgi:hypothetical protein